MTRKSKRTARRPAKAVRKSRGLVPSNGSISPNYTQNHPQCKPPRVWRIGTPHTHKRERWLRVLLDARLNCWIEGNEIVGLPHQFEAAMLLLNARFNCRQAKIGLLALKAGYKPPKAQLQEMVTA